MTSVGEALRSARESQGRTIAEIAEELCITQRYLRALESDDLNNLPGAFFYKSFVKQYAAILGVPWNSILPAIEALTRSEETVANSGAANPALAAEPAPIRVLDPLVEASNRRFSNRRIGLPVAALGGVLLVCSGFYSWWNQPPRQRAREEQPPVSRQALAPAPAVSPVQVSAATDSDTVNHVVLNLSATERTWLLITNSEGKPIFSGMLEPSQTKTLMASDAAQMKVGNAGGIDVRLNGKDIGPLGGRGQVRTVRFTAPDKFQIVEPAPETPDATL